MALALRRLRELQCQRPEQRRLRNYPRLTVSKLNVKTSMYLHDTSPPRYVLQQALQD